MSDPRVTSDSREAKVRAAKVRRHWSPAERDRRKGLPPDTPWSLLRQLLAPHTSAADTGFDRPVRRLYQSTFAPGT